MLTYAKILKSSNHFNILYADAWHAGSTQPVNIFKIKQKLCILEQNREF